MIDNFKIWMSEKYSRACLMYSIRPESPIREIQRHIPEKYLADITEDNGDIVNGIQIYLHSTVLYGLENNVNLDELKPFLSKYRGTNLIINGIDHFENEENVCVLKVESGIAELHYAISRHFDVNLTHSDYKPHITLAYLKKEYFFNHPFTPFQLVIDDFIFSDANGHHTVI